MSCTNRAPALGRLGVFSLAACTAFVLFSWPAWPASLRVDLDEDGTAESSVDLTVVRPYPPQIRSQVTNRAVGDEFDFDWPTAGPGGLSLSTGEGTAEGVGAIWNWSTIRQVYSLSCIATSTTRPCMTFTNLADASMLGPFTVPGRSLTPSSVTTTSASLTSSLLTFFSPPSEILRLVSEVRQLDTGGFRYLTRIVNLGEEPIEYSLPPGPLGCELQESFAPAQLDCGQEAEECDGVCCSPGACGEGGCVECVEGLSARCGDPDEPDGRFCQDLLFDDANCGECSNECASGTFCSSGECVPEQIAGCDFDGATGLVATGEEQIVDCRIDTHPAKEVTSRFEACGADVPEAGVVCGSGASGSGGTANLLVPDETVNIGDAFVSLLGARIQDASGDGLIGPGEPIKLFLPLVNAGPETVSDVQAVLSVPEADVDGNGSLDGVSLGRTASGYPPIPGAATLGGSADCDTGTPLPLVSVENEECFPVEFAEDHPGDTARVFNLLLTGQTSSGPFSQDVRFVLGVRDACVPGNQTGDFDGVDGFRLPLAALVPAGVAPPMPKNPLLVNQTLNFKIRLSCAGERLTEADTPAPRIVSLTRDGAPVDLEAENLGTYISATTDYFFWFNDHTLEWIYNMKTAPLGPGTYVIRVQMPDGRFYESGFDLKVSTTIPRFNPPAVGGTRYGGPGPTY